jgi:hypothetical protein
MKTEIEKKIEKLKAKFKKEWDLAFTKEIRPLILAEAKKIAKKYPNAKEIVSGMGTATISGKFLTKNEDGEIVEIDVDDANDPTVKNLLTTLTDLQYDDYGYCMEDIDLNKLRK